MQLLDQILCVKFYKKQLNCSIRFLNTPHIVIWHNSHLSLCLILLTFCLSTMLYFFLYVFVRAQCLDADGMSGGEDSFNVNDPDEGFSSGASNSSQPSGTKAGGSVGPRGGSLNSSSSSIKKAITARLSRDKEKEREREREAEKQAELLADHQAVVRRHHQRQQSPPASINLDSIQLSPIKKHLSFPVGPTLVRTGSTSSSKSFDCMSFNLNGGGEDREEGPGGSDKEGVLPTGGSHRHSTISLQEEHLIRPEDAQDLLSPGAPLSKQSRSPSFNMQIISQV